MQKSTICITLIFIFGIILFQCNDVSIQVPKKNLNQPDLTIDEVKRLILLDTNYVYPLASATKDAIQIATELDQEDSRKGLHIKRTIGEVISYSIPDTIRFPKAVNHKNDPGFYVFNYSGNNGFATISGDERLMGRLGYSGKGTIDNDPHTGLRIFLSRVVDLIQSQRQKMEAMRGDSIYFSLIKKLNSFQIPGKSAKDNQNQRAEVGPCGGPITRSAYAPCNQDCSITPIVMLDHTTTNVTTPVPAIIQTQWDQSPPFNNNFASSCGSQTGYCHYQNNNYAAGCVPVSEAQVIANFYARKYPDWAAITSIGICDMNAMQVNQVSSLIKNVYNCYLFKGMSCQKGTFTFDQSFIGLTVGYGISPVFGLVQGEWRDYNNGDLETSLKGNSPVPVHGSQHQWCVLFNWGCAPDPTCMHQWVMDGIQTLNQTSYYVGYQVNYTTCTYASSFSYTSNSVLSTYIHNNWGWGGDADGWYTEGAFGGPDINGITYPKQASSNAFNHNDKIIAYITAR